MALFDLESDPLGGAAVTPDGSLDATNEQQPVPPPIAVPDMSPMVAAMPGHVPIPPPQPLPNPANDPAHRLMALFAAGLSAGLGPRSGVGAGLGYQIGQSMQEQHDLALKQWQVNENERQRQIQTITQQNAELDRQRANNLQKSLESFAQGASRAETKEDYDKLADAYGNGLSASGYRITPNWLRANIPWQAPSRQDKIKKALAKFKANPNNQRLLEQQPELASQIMLNIDDGMPVRLDQALELNGEGFAKGPNGELLIVPKPMAGTAPFDVILQGKMDQWRMEHPGQIMTPADKNTLIAAANEQAKVKPAESPLDIELKQALLADRKRGADNLVKVEHKDPSTGKTVIEWIPKSQLQGRTFEKGISGTVESRLASAEAASQTGDDIISQLSDPKFAAKFGPAIGRYNSLREFIGNPPPEYQELAGSIESYALSNMGVHGMRSSQGAEMIKKALESKQTPQSIIAFIKGMNKFSKHFMENEGRKTGTTQVPPSALDSADSKLGIPR